MKNRRVALENLRIAGLGAKKILDETKKRYEGQVGVLNILIEEDGITQSDIAEILDINPSSVAEFVKKLEKAMLIRREADAFDGRVRRVFITKEGKDFLLKIGRTEEERSIDLFTGLNEEEITSLTDLLEKLIGSWDDTFLDQLVDSPSERLQDFQEFRMRPGFSQHDFQRNMHHMMRHGEVEAGDFHQWAREFKNQKRALRQTFNERREMLKDLPWQERRNREREMKMALWDELNEKMFSEKFPKKRRHPGPQFRNKQEPDEKEWQDF